MDKLKTILLAIFSIAIILLIIYFSFISPVAVGIARFGIVKVALGIIAVLLALTWIVNILHDDRIQDPYSSILVFAIIAGLVVLCKKFY